MSLWLVRGTGQAGKLTTGVEELVTHITGGKDGHRCQVSRGLFMLARGSGPSRADSHSPPLEHSMEAKAPLRRVGTRRDGTTRLFRRPNEEARVASFRKIMELGVLRRQRQNPKL